MARARNIKPAIFKNEVLGMADPLLTILFEGLWCLADREGYLEDRPARIKAEVFPYRDALDCNVYLTELEQMGFIRRFQTTGNLCLIHVIEFKKHQHPHVTEKPSELVKFDNPDSCCIHVKQPEDNLVIHVKQLEDNGTATSDSLNTDSLNTRSPTQEDESIDGTTIPPALAGLTEGQDDTNIDQTWEIPEDDFEERDEHLLPLEMDPLEQAMRPFSAGDQKMLLDAEATVHDLNMIGGLMNQCGGTLEDVKREAV